MTAATAMRDALRELLAATGESTQLSELRNAQDHARAALALPPESAINADMLVALQNIASDTEELANVDGISLGEQRAWRGIMFMARAAIAKAGG
jgi:hypothetical protein